MAESLVPEFITTVADFVDDTCTEMAERIRLLHDFFGYDEEDVFNTIGCGGYTLESVTLAIYCFLKSPHDFEATVIRAVNAGVDADNHVQ